MTVALYEQRDRLAAALAVVKPRSHAADAIARELRAITNRILRHERRAKRKEAA